ncbi:hypothetical protein ACFOOM_01200 [Streptomyces echinoruber]|uniref:Uncharacterized protein n=1 Tax=Streptomyces echinoruber TaxID=68898 RepID=A0A918V6G6_9ACTN|nr:hypothetical protein [Streptomyces echinoruber]GGZ72953.1 hypothetical protein GCM10010389_07930 [Streptomyces echinoruber]
MQYDTPEELRAFLRLCLAGPGREKCTPARLVEILPEPMHDELTRHAPHLRAMRHRLDALATQRERAHQEYADALAAWIRGEEPEPAGERYVIGRNGVFATLYDRKDERLLVENATEEHCRRVRDELLAGEPQPADRPVPLPDAVTAAHDAAVAHAVACGTCWPGARLAEMCDAGQRAALAGLAGQAAKVLAGGQGEARKRLEDLEGLVTEYRLPPAPPAYTPLIVRRDPAYDGTRWAILHDPGDSTVRRAWTADGWEMAWSLTHQEVFCWPDAETALAQARRAQAQDDEHEPDVDGAGRTPAEYHTRP